VASVPQPCLRTIEVKQTHLTSCKLRLTALNLVNTELCLPTITLHPSVPIPTHFWKSAFSLSRKSNNEVEIASAVSPSSSTIPRNVVTILLKLMLKYLTTTHSNFLVLISVLSSIINEYDVLLISCTSSSSRQGARTLQVSALHLVLCNLISALCMSAVNSHFTEMVNS